ncbi:hypothetical protein [Agriterribacter sp.]|uniref:hypothetical protein n=1 Tax=Agriterribacter sp. TaxID=2821509 RepID=UPI002CBF0CFC|nr:hypothetical protein [Agriterribacter sp.]HRP56589.1 hypothetical protein [Agriterribacter sp.]
MKYSMLKRLNHYIGTLLLFSVLPMMIFAQDTVQISEQEVSSWFGRNWMWITAGVILLLLIFLFSGGSSRRKTTTVVKDDYGNVKEVTTTEVRE